MAYESNNPQTNSSIHEFYQNLGYTWREYISEYDERIMPRIEIDGEIVLKDLLPNAPIQLRLETWQTEYGTGSRIHRPLNQAEVLLARATLKHIPEPGMNQIDVDDWYIDKKPYIWEGHLVGWITDSNFKTQRVGWWKDWHDAAWNYSLYSSWLTDKFYFTNYPKILYFDPINIWTKIRMLRHSNEYWYYKDKEEIWESERNSFRGLRIYHEEFLRNHFIYYVYKLEGENWNLYETITLDQWDWLGLSARFHGWLNFEQANLDIHDKRINILMDINDVILSQ